MDDIKKKKIAVMGVSNKEEKFGFRIFRDLIKAGFNVEGVNPTNGEVLGKKIYRNLKEISARPELVITVVPYQVTERVVDECNALGIKEIWMQPGSESEAAVLKAKSFGIKATSNSCFMVVNNIW